MPHQILVSPDIQIRNPDEMVRIAGDHGHTERSGRGGDPNVVRADDFPARSQLSINRSEMPCDLRGKTQHMKRGKKSFPPRAIPTQRRSGRQLTGDRKRDHQRLGRILFEKSGRRALDAPLALPLEIDEKC